MSHKRWTETAWNVGGVIGGAACLLFIGYSAIMLGTGAW